MCWIVGTCELMRSVLLCGLANAEHPASEQCLRMLVPAAATLTATYNNLDSVRAVFEAHKGEIAGVILEPVVGNSGYIAPTKEFLQVHCPMADLGRFGGRGRGGVGGLGDDLH